MTVPSPINRRRFFATTGAAALTAASAKTASASDDGFQFEVTRSDAEWREMLTDMEYVIMREGKTERPQSSPLWIEVDEGGYHCRGCELKVFDGRWKSILEKGWVFFFHAEPNSVLTGIDGNVPEYGSMSAGKDALTEIHCRRCGSHLGHFLVVEGYQRHCINGTSLTFRPAAA